MMKRTKKSKDEKISKERADESTKVEVTVENGDSEAEVEAGAQPTEKLDVADSLEAKNAELEDRLLRTLADFDNYKKRTARQYEMMMASANDRLLTDLLEVLDNFERALSHDNGNDESGESFRQGVAMIYNQMQGLLDRFNVTPIESVGQPFDANLHEAMMQMPSDEFSEGVIASEISKGYMIGDRVLRHSKVAVSTGPANEDKE